MGPVLQKILPALKTVAPVLATTLGGPLAGMAVKTLAAALGTNPEKPDELVAAIANLTPETAAQLRKGDQDFAVRMKELDIDVEKLAQEDRAGARTMQIQTRDITPRILAFGVTAGFFSLLVMMAFRALPDANTDILQIMIGFLGGSFSSVVSFYFGSSAGSQAKDATIRQAVNGK